MASPPGNTNPCHVLASYPRSPVASATVGRSGVAARALRARHRERAHLAGLDLRYRRRKRRHHHRHASGHEIEERRAAALVGNVHELDAGEDVQELAREMLRRSEARRREIDLLAASPFAISISSFMLRAANEGCTMKTFGDSRELRDRREIPDRIEADARVETRARDEIRRGEEQRVAVGRRVRDELGADVAGGAGPIVRDDLLAEALAELLRDDAADGVRRAARRLRNDEADRAARGYAVRRRRCERAVTCGDGEQPTRAARTSCMPVRLSLSASRDFIRLRRYDRDRVFRAKTRMDTTEPRYLVNEYAPDPDVDVRSPQSRRSTCGTRTCSQRAATCRARSAAW